MTTARACVLIQILLSSELPRPPSFDNLIALSTIVRQTKGGAIRDDPDGCLNASVFTAQTAPGDKSNLLVPTAHAGIWMRSVDVYVPSGYVAGSEAPFIVLGDSGYPN